jgi:orotate phosphoribosyltransferase
MTPEYSSTSPSVSALDRIVRNLPDSPIGHHLSEEDVLAYGSEALSPEDAERVELHIATCDECGVKLEAFLEAESLEPVDAVEVARQQLLAVARKVVQCDGSAEDLVLPEPDALALLRSVEGIVCDADYELPCGSHTDTHVNVAALCENEQALKMISTILLHEFQDVVLDTVVVNGWAMGCIARRFAKQVFDRYGHDVDCVVAEGYGPQIQLSKPVRAGAEVLVLVDISVTGSLVDSLVRRVEAAGAVAVARGSLFVREALPGVRMLRQVPMSLFAPDDCPNCSRLSKAKVINSFPSAPVRQGRIPRSPSTFLREHPDAEEFWTWVDAAKAYRSHYVEGNIHYRAFVDTEKLLRNPSVATAMMSKLAWQIRHARYFPEVLVATDRPRAAAAAELLLQTLRGTLDYALRPAVFAKSMNGQ